MKNASQSRIAVEKLVFGRPRGGDRDPGFRPAFLDFATQRIYLACDSQPPQKPTLIAGFLRNGYFYTASAAKKAAAEWR